MLYIKTDAGKDAIKAHSDILSSKQRSGLILINGERSLDDLLKMVGGIGFTKADIDRMVELGLIVELPSNLSTTAKNPSNPSNPTSAGPLGGFVDVETAQARYKLAYPLATQLTAGMGLRGFRLNLAVEGAGSYSQLVQLFPKIQEATGAQKAKALEDALRGA
jgi:hypothetical protein